MFAWFVETTLVALGLAIVAILASRLRSIGPTARHLLWLVVLVKLMTPPRDLVALGGELEQPDRGPSALPRLRSRTCYYFRQRCALCRRRRS